jgi:hypothetical protein
VPSKTQACNNAIGLALRFKGDLAALGSLDVVKLSQGLSVGAVWTVWETARHLEPLAPDSQPNWHCGRFWPASWSGVPVGPLCA